MSFNIEMERLENIILKLAKGHAKYENNSPQFAEPTHFAYKTLHTMTEEEIEEFLSLTEIQKTPELGSRSMQNLIIDNYNNVSS